MAEARVVKFCTPVSREWQTNGQGQSHVTHFYYGSSIMSLELVKLIISKLVCWLILTYWGVLVPYPGRECVQGHVASLNYGKYLIISQK